jgi:HEAT repeat protein/ElaB/YqjD/DUF883 family membrane-anchored ribosome-binding protein
MSSLIDFQPYLESICHHYGDWWNFYTLMDVEGKEVANNRKKKGAAPFDFGLVVQPIKQKSEALEQEKANNQRFPVLEGLRSFLAKANHVLLVGQPGAGKSTTLARLLLEEAELNQKEDKKNRRIPVIVELRYYHTSILDLIRDFFKRHNLLLDTHQVETLLSSNRLFLLIDGLNELPSEAARQDIIKLRNYCNVPMIFTTRDVVLGGNFGIEEQLAIQPLTESQIQNFIHAYLPPAQAEKMRQEAHERIHNLAETPLLLWMLCELFEIGEEIPQNLGDVFRVFIRTYENSSIRKYEVAALKGDIQPLSDRRLWFLALKHLAYMMMQGETPSDFRSILSKQETEQEFKRLFNDEPYSSKTARDCLEDLLKYHLVRIKSENRIEFHHLLFQEYYAAEWLLTELPTLSDEQLKYYFLNYLKYTEILAFTLKLLDNKTQAKRIIKLALEVDLMLGTRLVREAKLQYQELLVDFITSQEISELLKTELLGQTHSKFAIPSLRKALENKNPDIRACSANALARLESRPNKITPKVDRVRDRSSLSWAFPPSLENLKLPEAFENFPEMALFSMGMALDEPDCSDRRWRAVWSLAVLGREAAVARLLKLKEWQKLDPSERLKVATKTVQWCRRTIIPELLRALQHPFDSIRWHAAEALGHLGSKEAIPDLIKALKDVTGDVRFSASDAIINIGDPESLTPLWELQRTSENFIAVSVTSWLILTTIQDIQARCKFYNYNIAQAPPPCPLQPTYLKAFTNNLSITSVGELTVMSEKPQINFFQDNAIIGVNYAAEGSKQEFTQYNNATEQNFEVLLTDFQQFIDDLERRYPNATDEAAIQIINVEARKIQDTQPLRWQNLLNLKRLWNGGKKAAIKVGEHFTEQNPWGKGAIAFLEGMMEDPQ